MVSGGLMNFNKIYTPQQCNSIMNLDFQMSLQEVIPKFQSWVNEVL